MRPKELQGSGLRILTVNLETVFRAQVSGIFFFFLCRKGFNLMSIGVRIPLFLISPFSSGGRLFTERADHNSHILFVGKY